jgi:WhiB family redox-sensing transcriptional regulator
MSAQSSPENWHAEAACRGMDPNIFHPARGEDVAGPKAVCAECPVKDPCLDYAIVTPGCSGVWGGLSQDERERIARSTRVCRRCLTRFTGRAQAYFCSVECRTEARRQSTAAWRRRRAAGA